MNVLMKAGVLLLCGLAVSCARYSPMFWGWGEWTDPGLTTLRGEESASLEWTDLPGVIAVIDGREVGRGYKRARLSPGSHTIEYAYYTSAFGENPSGAFEVTLASGHSYSFRIALCFWCSPRKYAAWMDDSADKQPVWGSRPDWSSWYL